MSAAQASAQSPVLHLDRLSGCRLAPPREMPQGVVNWIGACVEGQAQGPGVVRVTQARRSPAVNFYGLMRAGLPVRGVIEHDGGWLIGDFRDAARVEVRDDPDAGIKQFQAAVRGAEFAARYFAARRNHASAALYRAKAAQIDETSPGGH